MPTERFGRPLPSSFLPSDEANERIKLFKNSKYPLLSTALGRPDTKAIWYSFKQFEDIYKELVYLNCDGVRIYFSEYAATDEEFPGQLGVVLVPTRFNEDTNTSSDVLLENDSDFRDRPGAEMFVNRKLIKSYNYGSPCPPVCPLDIDLKYPFDNV